jgi:hypothetical protein
MATFYDMDAGVISSPTLRRFGQIMGYLNQHIRLCRLNDLNMAWKQQVSSNHLSWIRLGSATIATESRKLP